MGVGSKGEHIINRPAEIDGVFFWRYLDLHKLIDLLISKELFFTRLDLLDDPIEGLSTKNLRLNHQKKLLNEQSNLDSLKEYDKVLKDAEFEEQWGKIKQSQQFVNCWRHSSRESLAMWNLYSNNDSVAIKIVANDMLDFLENQASQFVEKNGFRLDFIADKVKYLPLNPFDTKLPKQKIRFSSFKKDETYEFEKEYRLLIYSNKKTFEPNTELEFFRFPFPFDKLNFNIICHPLMESWKRDNVTRLVAKFYKDNIVKKSDIYLKK